jgi:hypothetical protein
LDRTTPARIKLKGAMRADHCCAPTRAVMKANRGWWQPAMPLSEKSKVTTVQQVHHTQG